MFQTFQPKRDSFREREKGGGENMEGWSFRESDLLPPSRNIYTIQKISQNIGRDSRAQRWSDTKSDGKQTIPALPSHSLPFIDLVLLKNRKRTLSLVCCLHLPMVPVAAATVSTSFIGAEMLFYIYLGLRVQT